MLNKQRIIAEVCKLRPRSSLYPLKVIPLQVRSLTFCSLGQSTIVDRLILDAEAIAPFASRGNLKKRCRRDRMQKRFILRKLVHLGYESLD